MIKKFLAPTENLLLLSKTYLIIIIPLKRITSKAFVALVEFFSSENGVGWIIPFHNSLNFKIFNELSKKDINSLDPTKNKKNKPRK